MHLLARRFLRAAICVPLLASGPLVAATPVANATDADVLSLEFNARLRSEFVTDGAFEQDGQATTMRLRAGVRAKFGYGWTGFLEAEGVAALSDQYNSGANGRVAYPAIIDPGGAEVNQAWLAWRGATRAATIGRQRLRFDNQRWIGSSTWRQNEQTFDAVTLDWTPTKRVVARYAWLDRVHRVNGDQALDVFARERNVDSHLLDVDFSQVNGQLGAYAYAHADDDVPGASTLTLGLRWKRNQASAAPSWGWRIEAARQTEYADNPARFSHDYWLLEPWAKWRKVTWRAGWEHLGGNGQHALQTPLASLHLFNGWADKFLSTPANGLDDRYLGAAGNLGSMGRSTWTWALEWHDYRADHGTQRYGSEVNASLGFPLLDRLTGLVKVADYRSQDFGADTRKLWLQLEWIYQ